MKRIIFLFLLLSIVNCQRNQVIKTHGVPYLEKKHGTLVVNKTNKNDVRKALGHPSTEGLFDQTIWIYIERVITRGKLLHFGRNVLSKNNVLVLKFDKYGVLLEKQFYDKEKMKKIEFTKEITKSVSREKDFIYSFLSSLRQKLNRPNPIKE